MRQKTTLVSALALVLLLTSTVGGSLAQGRTTDVAMEGALGSAFAYQGRLTDSSGPLNDTCDFDFELYDAASGCCQVGTTVSKYGVQVVDGLFAEQLDFGTSAFTGDDRWLEITVDCGGGAATLPRQAITAAPYALYALKAPWSGLDGRPEGLDDGDDDTTYDDGPGLSLVGTTFSADTSYLQRRVTGACSEGNAIRVVNADGSATCQATTYTNGPGLNLVGTTFSADTDYLQRRVNGTCTEGNAIRVVNADGSVTCQATGGEIEAGTEVTGNLADFIFGASNSGNGPGLQGTSAGGEGVYGLTTSTDGTISGVAGANFTGQGPGVVGTAGSGTHVIEPGDFGIYGYSAGDSGVYGRSSSGVGVRGKSANSYGVEGVSTNWPGVQGTSTNDCGVYGYGENYEGVYGQSGGDEAGVRGVNWTGEAGGHGVVGTAGSGTHQVPGTGHIGVYGYSTDNYGVMGRTGATYGVVTPNKMLATAYDTGSPDVAEFYLDAVGDLEPGDVVVFDPGGGLRLMRSVRAYDTAVAGVISTEPGITLAVRDGEIIAGDNEGEVPLALIGRVPCKASAENGPIAVGDLLTTSSTVGHAMKAIAPPPGTVLGKALEPLHEGSGIVLVLITLQ